MVGFGNPAGSLFRCHVRTSGCGLGSKSGGCVSLGLPYLGRAHPVVSQHAIASGVVSEKSILSPCWKPFWKGLAHFHCLGEL